MRYYEVRALVPERPHYDVLTYLEQCGCREIVSRPYQLTQIESAQQLPLTNGRGRPRNPDSSVSRVQTAILAMPPSEAISKKILQALGVNEPEHAYRNTFAKMHAAGMLERVGSGVYRKAAAAQAVDMRLVEMEPLTKRTRRSDTVPFTFNIIAQHVRATGQPMTIHELRTALQAAGRSYKWAVSI